MNEGLAAATILTPMAKLGAPPRPASPGAKQAVIVVNLRCPICHAWWIFEFMMMLAKIHEVPGSFKGVFNGQDVWKIDSSAWGAHTLCGTCSAKHRAFMPNGTLFGVPARVWTESDEKTMWGRLKHQQQEYAALLGSRLPDGTPLRDEQRDVRESILQKGSIMISRDRCKSMKLGWGDVG